MMPVPVGSARIWPLGPSRTALMRLPSGPFISSARNCSALVARPVEVRSAKRWVWPSRGSNSASQLSCTRYRCSTRESVVLTALDWK